MISIVLSALICLSHAASVPEKRESYNLFIKEKGTFLEETVTVDEASNTVMIDIPPHNDIRGTKYIMDYSQKKTLRYDPELDECYLSEMDAFHKRTSPRKVLTAMRKSYGSKPTEDVEIIKTEWRLSGLASKEEVSHLKPQLQAMCRGRPVFRMSPVKEVVSVGTPLRGNRVRRQDIPGDSTCTRAKQTTHCYHRLRCSFVLKIECEEVNVAGQQFDDDGVCVNANTYHNFEDTSCCINCCTDPLQGDSIYPACNSINENNFSSHQCVEQ